jgi:predicted Zn-dependent peptidase
MMDYNTFTLENGIRLIHKPVASLIAHAGLFMNTGSRDEDKNEHGLAHFIEHVVFKGTKKRKSYHINSRLEDVGGELNAYTTKEETCIHASFLKEDIVRALELISDITFNSIFPEKEVEKEKEIIIDEINSYKDNPAELIFDDFEEMLFPFDSLGRNILGTPEMLRNYERKDLLDFVDKNYNTDEMILSIVGDIENSKLIKLANEYYGKISTKHKKIKRSIVTEYSPEIREEIKNTYQTHCVIGTKAYSFVDSRRLTLHLLNNILGGPGMNSRLNLSLRERNGCTYNVESSYSPYFDTGVFGVYFGADKENLEKSLKLIHKEFNLLRTKELGTIQLSKAKKQLIGQIAISAEHNENLMISMGKSYLVFGKVDSLQEINRQIENISALELMEVANDILDAKKLSTIVYK